MKMKSLLSFFVPAAMMSLMVAGCSDYDNGYDTNAIKFAQEFRKTFGDIDPEQDWNLAERGTVTVSTMKESEVKIYALTGDEYTIVGDYQGVKGTQMLGFDMVEGTKSILVTDGVTAEKTVPGGVVTFGGTRAIFTDPDDRNGDGVKVAKIPAGGTIIKGVEYKQYKEINAQDYAKMVGVIPEIGSRTNHTNLPKVTHDFSYVSNGEFVIYPYFWNTSSDNTIGIYWTDDKGPHEVNIYQNKGEGVEVHGEASVEANLKGARLRDQARMDGTVSKRFWSGSENLQAAYYQDYQALIYAPLKGIQIENLGLPHDIRSYDKLVINADLKNGTPDFRLIFYALDDNGAIIDDNSKVVIPINQSGTDVTIDLTNLRSENGNLFNKANCDIRLSGSNNQNSPTWNHSMGLNDCRGDIVFNKVTLVKANNGWEQYNGNNSNDIVQGSNYGRSQGVVVNIPEGTKFGMYLKKHDSVVGDCTFYSESSKNTNRETHGWGVTDDGAGHVNFEDHSSNASFASTFYVGDQMFLGFEDWPNNTNVWGGSDFDLNDIVLAFDGSKPTIINEEADKWLLACEDLGGSFDIDYNDVVFSVEHISGQPKAKLTPLAAGGTLASYIYFQDPLGSRDKLFGEIHQLFGAEPVKSGEFEIVNARSRYEKTAQTIEFDVDENWTLAYYSTGETGGTNYGGAVNMGGFEIRTLKSGEEAPLNFDLNDAKFSGASKIQPSTLDRGDNVPYILCLPYSYKHFNYNRATREAGKKTVCVWAWPTEFTTICNEDGTSGPYKDFAGWVQNKNNNTDWYKNKDYQNADAATVDNLFLSVSNMTQAEINANSGNGGNNGDWLSSTALTSYTLTVVPGSSNGTYTIKYGDDTVVVSNVTSIKLSVAELPKYATVTANNDGYSVQESVFTDEGTTGVIQITSADLANCLNGNGNLYVHENSGSIAFKLKVE